MSISKKEAWATDLQCLIDAEVVVYKEAGNPPDLSLDGEYSTNRHDDIEMDCLFENISPEVEEDLRIIGDRTELKDRETRLGIFNL